NVDPQNDIGPARRSVIATYYCPSRRAPGLYYNSAKTSARLTNLSDFCAANPGHVPLHSDETAGGNGTYNGVIRPILVFSLETGNLKYSDAPVKIADVTDGTSNTLLAADKWVPTNEYNGSHWADDTGPMAGWDGDTMRSTVSSKNCA